MKKKPSAVEILCTEKISSLLGRVPFQDVFNKRRVLVETALFESRSTLTKDLFLGELSTLRSCDGACPDYCPASEFSKNNLCEQDFQPALEEYCRYRYLPIAQR